MERDWNFCKTCPECGTCQEYCGNLSTRGQFFGVNYGNRFIPEKWMWTANTGEETFFWEGVTAQGKEPGADHTRLSLPDLGADKFAERMPQWLDMMTLESYFDKIFEWAKKYGLQILLDLHGMPGSNNGAEHGGICMETPYWHLPGNVEKTLEAVRAMAEYSADKGDTLYGLEVINEPMNFNHDIHGLLDSYYERAILEARAHLAAHIPIIVYEWTFNMHKWPTDRFPESEFGKVMWDTHIYTVWKTTHTMEETMDVYRGDMQKLQEFNSRQAGGALVGEWSLAGTEYDETYTPEEKADRLRELALWVVWGFMEG